VRWGPLAKGDILDRGRLEEVFQQYRPVDSEVAHGLRSMSLRYFNAAGADPDGEIGEERSSEGHLIPLVLQTAMGSRPHVTIFGTDYDTPDGA
jgi:UDP-glucose 4-epimerase